MRGGRNGGDAQNGFSSSSILVSVEGSAAGVCSEVSSLSESEVASFCWPKSDGIGFAVPLQSEMKGSVSFTAGTTARGGAHFAKCFFFVAFSFWLTGVIMLSVGEMYVGLLSGHTNKAHRGRKAD